MPSIATHRIVAALGAALPMLAGAVTIGTQQSTDGTHKDELHWVDFANVAGTIPAGIDTAYEADVPSGGPAPLKLVFNLRPTGAATATRAFRSFSGSALGQAGKYQTGGQPALRSARPNATLELSNIALRNNAGWRLRLDWVVADAESTDYGEYIRGTAVGGWTQYDRLDPSAAWTPQSDVTLTLAGNDFAIESTNVTGSSYAPAYLLATNNPDSFVITNGGSGGGAQIVAFAVVPLIPQASIACNPANLQPGQSSTCTVTVTNPPLDAYSLPVTVAADPALNASDCNRTLNFAAKQTTATCTITASPTAPASAQATATITASPGNYTLGTPSAQVTVGAAPNPVPTLSSAALALMGLLLGGLGWVRRKQA
jgi:hypothetical protein